MVMDPAAAMTDPAPPPVFFTPRPLPVRMSDLVEAFRSVDADLRILATLRPTSWQVEWTRADLQGTYDESDLEDAYRSLMAAQVSVDDFGKVGSFGEFRAQQYVFEEIVVFQFPSSRYEAVFASYDREDPFPVQEVLETRADVPVLE